MQNYYLPLKAPTPLPATGVDTVSFKVWKNTLVAHLEQDAAHYHFMSGGRYETWKTRESGKLITTLVVDDPDKKVLDDKLTAGTLTANTHAAAIEVLLNKRNAQLAKFITHTATLCYYTEHDDITMQSTSLAWIFAYLTNHYGLETKGANFLKISDSMYKKDQPHQTFYKQYRAAFIDNLRKKNDILKYKNDFKLTEDEQLSPSFENAIVLWALEKIDARLPAKVKKNYGHQMTGNMSLKDLQPVIFQNISSMLEELDQTENTRSLASLSVDDESPSLNAIYNRNIRGKFRGGRNQRGSRGRGAPAPRSSRPPTPGNKFCRICSLAGSDERIFSSHEIGNCSRLTMRDMESLRSSLVLNGIMIDEASQPEQPTYFFQPGWDDQEAEEHVEEREPQ